MNSKKGSRVIHVHLHRTIHCQHLGWHPSQIRSFSEIKIMNCQTPDSDLSFIRATSPPNNETKNRKHENKAEESNQNLTPPGVPFVCIELIVVTFLFDDVTLGPPFVVPLPASEGAGKAAGRGGPRVPAVRRVRWGVGWGVVGRGVLHGGRLVLIVGVARRALHVVHVASRRSR